MSKNILVRMEIPILSNKIVNTPSMIFNKWMPLNEEDFIVVSEGNISLKLWFDRSCSHNVPLAGEDISRHVNVLVDKVFADVTINDLSEGLIEYIKITASETQPPEGPYKKEYRELGKKLYLLTLTYLNRLISYARSMKGQYWLQEYPINKAEGLYGVNLAFDARVLINSEWFRWFSDVKHLIIGREGGSQDSNRFIDRDTWKQAKEFIGSKSRASLVWELIAGAEWLAGIGHRRSALTEAVTALETAISEFSKKPQSEEAFGILNSKRIEVSSLKNAVERFGFSGTLHYLFPVIFSEEKMPIEVLRDCQEAVEQRQNVVHNAQRDVREDKLLVYIKSIQRMCRILESYCQK